MFPKTLINEVPVLKCFTEANKERNRNMNNLENAINEIKKLLEEADRNAENAACGYDSGWYNGEGNAYETVLEILEKVIS